MLKKFLLKISNIFYKIHIFIDRSIKSSKEKTPFSPYILNYNPCEIGPKIIHINGNFIVGGTSQLIVDIIENTSSKYIHKIIVPEYPDPLPYQPIDIHKFSINEIKEVYDFLNIEQPIIVHIHYWVRHTDRYTDYALWYGAIFKICEELNLRVIQNINVPTHPYHSSAVVTNVFVSEYVSKNFNNSLVEASVIYPGSNFNHFKNTSVAVLPDNSIGMVYRLDKDKLNAEAIEVFIAVAKKKNDVQCYIVGGGYYLSYYKQRVADEKLEQNFIFTGFISYNLLPDYYKKMSVFVAPVHDESFGQVTPFAMSMGLCIAGYDTGALSEIVGSNSTLAQYGNIDQLSNIIVELINNPQKRMRLGISNQSRSHNKFSVETMVNKYNVLYSTFDYDYK